MAQATTCLWYDREAEAAATLYVSLVPASRIDRIVRSPSAWPGGNAGDVITVDFVLAGQRFQGLNGGGGADFGMAASISVLCADQRELDRLWGGLLASGGAPIQCGWIRDVYGVPWQVVPEALPRLLGDPDRLKAERVFAAMRTMIKLDADALARAAEG